MRYVYRGDKWTDESLKGQPCDPVRRFTDGKCIVGQKLGSQLVVFASGEKVVVMRRRLKVVNG